MARRKALEAQLHALQGEYARVAAQTNDFVAVTAPAILAVARLLEQKAETMAIAQGCDIAKYHELVGSAHRLRSALGDTTDEIRFAADGLCHELTQRFTASPWAGVERIVAEPDVESRVHRPSA